MGNAILSHIWHDIAFALRVGMCSNVAKNAASLYVIQFAQYIFPLITVPYLVRALEPSGYGLVAFGQSFISYFTILADFGFAFSATRKISLQREDILSVSTTASHVWASKSLLAVAGFLLLMLAIALIPKLHESSALLIVLYGAVIGSVLFPTWLFQGMERMVAISVINLMMQLFILIGVFILIHRSEDYMAYAVLISTGSILSGFAGAFIAIYMFKIRLVFPSKRGIIETLRDGWVLFLSMASISLYTAGNAFILGLLASSASVGYYSAAEKIVKALVGLLGPISQAAYPRFSRMALESRAKALQWGRRMLFLMGSVGLALSLAIFIAAPLIIRIILGPEYEPSINVMRILAVLPFMIAASTVLGAQIALPFGLEKIIFISVFVAGIVNIILAMLLVPSFGASGMAISVSVAETIVTSSEFLYLSIKKNI